MMLCTPCACHSILAHASYAQAVVFRSNSVTKICAHRMKEVIAEYPLVLSQSPTPVTIYRFPTRQKDFCPVEIKLRPSSGYTEIKLPFPQKNMSALKLKLLNTNSLAFRSIPTHPASYYHATVESERIVLTQVQSLYLFEPMHQYYMVEMQSTALRKAESREELEHRKRSINYKLKNLENEEFVTMDYEDATKIEMRGNSVSGLKGRGSATPGTSTNATQPDGLSKTAVAAGQVKSTSNGSKTVCRNKIENVIKNARIVNASDLINIFGNKMAVNNVLFKMTDRIAGRFILKNAYYEKRLWEPRSTLLNLFRGCGETSISSTRFLGDESWLADEIADRVGTKYVLRGYKESTDFDASAIEDANRRHIRALFEKARMQSQAGISQQTAIDEEIIHRILCGPSYLHLANNSYVLDDSSYWFNPVLKAFAARRSMELSVAQELLCQNEAVYNEEDLVAEMKVYCNQRGGKYFLKIMKE